MEKKWNFLVVFKNLHKWENLCQLTAGFSLSHPESLLVKCSVTTQTLSRFRKLLQMENFQICSTCNFWRQNVLRFDIIYVLALQQIPWNNFLFKPPANVSHGKTFSKHFPLSSLTKAKFFSQIFSERWGQILMVNY